MDCICHFYNLIGYILSVEKGPCRYALMESNQSVSTRFQWESEKEPLFCPSTHSHEAFRILKRLFCLCLVKICQRVNR